MGKMKGVPQIAFDKAVQYAKLKHKEEYNDPAFQRDIEESELDFARGFMAGYNYWEILLSLDQTRIATDKVKHKFTKGGVVKKQK